MAKDTTRRWCRHCTTEIHRAGTNEEWTHKNTGKYGCESLRAGRKVAQP